MDAVAALAWSRGAAAVFFRRRARVGDSRGTTQRASRPRRASERSGVVAALHQSTTVVERSPSGRLGLGLRVSGEWSDDDGRRRRASRAPRGHRARALERQGALAAEALPFGRAACVRALVREPSPAPAFDVVEQVIKRSQMNRTVGGPSLRDEECAGAEVHRFDDVSCARRKRRAKAPLRRREPLSISSLQDRPPGPLRIGPTAEQSLGRLPGWCKRREGRRRQGNRSRLALRDRGALGERTDIPERPPTP